MTKSNIINLIIFIVSLILLFFIFKIQVPSNIFQTKKNVIKHFYR